MEFQSYTDARGGSLTPIDLSNIPFEVKRCFLIKDVPKGSVRGEHAHYKTCQLFVCLSGRIDMTLFDGTVERKMVLESGQSAIIDKMVWGKQEYLTGNEVAVVFCSTDYDRKDYIENIDQFNKIIGI